MKEQGGACAKAHTPPCSRLTIRVIIRAFICGDTFAVAREFVDFWLDNRETDELILQLLFKISIPETGEPIMHGYSDSVLIVLRVIPANRKSVQHLGIRAGRRQLFVKSG